MGIPTKPVFHGKYPAVYFFVAHLVDHLSFVWFSRNVVVAAACPCGPALEIQKQKHIQRWFFADPTSQTFGEYV